MESLNNMNEYDFTRFRWLTPFQLRNLFLSTSKITTELVHFLKVAALDEQARRKSLSELYVQCPRCKGYHDLIVINNDNLCDKCEQMVHVLEYDKTH